MGNSYLISPDRYCLLSVIEILEEYFSESEFCLFLESFNLALKETKVPLRIVWKSLHYWLLTDPDIGITTYCDELPYQTSVQKIVDLYEKSILGDLIEGNDCQALQKELRQLLRYQIDREKERGQKYYARGKAIMGAISAVGILECPYKQDQIEESQIELGGDHAALVYAIIEAAWEAKGSQAATQTAIAIINKLFSLLR